MTSSSSAPRSGLAPVAGADGPADWKRLADGLTGLGLRPPPALRADPGQPLQRGELAAILWPLVRDKAERLPDLTTYLRPGSDVDGDGLADLDDPLPFRPGEKPK